MPFSHEDHNLKLLYLRPGKWDKGDSQSPAVSKTRLLSEHRETPREAISMNKAEEQSKMTPTSPQAHANVYMRAHAIY